MRRNRLLHSTPASRQRITPKPSTINKKQLNNSKLLNIIWLPGWRRYMVGSGLAWLGPGVADHFPFGVDRVVISERTVFGPRCLVKQTVCAYDCLVNSYINGMLFHARSLACFVHSFVCLFKYNFSFGWTMFHTGLGLGPIVTDYNGNAVQSVGMQPSRAASIQQRNNGRQH